MTTENRLTTSGETDGIQERLENKCEGLAAKHTVPVREHHISSHNTDKQSIPPGSFDEGGGGGERPSTEDTTVTTQLVQGTLIGTTAETKCQCG